MNTYKKHRGEGGVIVNQTRTRPPEPRNSSLHAPRRAVRLACPEIPESPRGLLRIPHLESQAPRIKFSGARGRGFGPLHFPLHAPSLHLGNFAYNPGTPVGKGGL